jgi:hypothetical protein
MLPPLLIALSVPALVLAKVCTLASTSSQHLLFLPLLSSLLSFL